MTGRIPDEFIQELLSRLDIVSIVESRIALRRAGREHKACCPFHDEKTPSFTVSPDKQFYHCFGCNANGSAISFVMEYDGLSFVDAVEELAKSAGLEIPRGRGTPQADHSDLYAAMSSATQWFQERLAESRKAGAYLEQRGLNQEITGHFEIGFAPDQWDGLISTLKRNGTSETTLHKSGLVSSSDSGRTYDRFRNRLMFPIHDQRGRTVAFGGRILDGEGPKYLNSPETALFHKGAQLFGAHQIRQQRRQQGRCENVIVVEGYMDTVSLAQFDILNSVATLGTATTERQVELLFRIAPSVTFCFDGDRAGRQAAWRAVEATLPRMGSGRQAACLFLPEGQDPDSMVRAQGSEAFRRQIHEAEPIADFFFRHMAEGIDLSRMDGKARLTEQAMPLIKQVPEGAFRELLGTQLHNLTGTLSTTSRHTPQVARAQSLPQRQVAASSPARIAIALLLQRPALAGLEEAQELIPEKCDKGGELLAALLEFAQSDPTLSTAMLLEHWRDTEHEGHLARLAGTEQPGSDKELRQVFVDALRRLQLSQISARIANIERELLQGTATTADKSNLRECLQQKSRLSSLLQSDQIR